MCALAVSLAPAGTPDEQANALVAGLGSTFFGEREDSERKLERLGFAALPALHSARASLDPEIRRRAGMLVERIERTAESARNLEIAPVSLHFDQVPLGTAVLEFRSRTKIPVTLDAAGVANPLRPVTLKLDSLPPWQALEAFCKAAGLREVFAPELTPPKTKASRFGRGLPVPDVAFVPSAVGVPIVLVDGSYLALPGERSGAVRVTALPPRFRNNRLILGTGEVTLHLDVTPLAGRNWQETLGVRVRNALDAEGRPVHLSHRPDDDLTEPLSDEGNVFMNARIVNWNGNGSDMQPPIVLQNPRLLPLTLKTAERAIRFLKVLEGDVQIEVQEPMQPLLTVELLAKAAQTTHEAPNSTKVTIADLIEEARRPDQTTIKLRLEGPSPWVLQQMKAQRAGAFLGGNFGGQVLLEPPIAPTPGPQFQVCDANGRTMSVSTTTTTNGQSDDGMTFTSEVNITVRGRAPAKLVMIGPKTVTVNVPFRLENVPLP